MSQRSASSTTRPWKLSALAGGSALLAAAGALGSDPPERQDGLSTSRPVLNMVLRPYLGKVEGRQRLFVDFEVQNPSGGTIDVADLDLVQCFYRDRILEVQDAEGHEIQYQGLMPPYRIPGEKHAPERQLYFKGRSLRIRGMDISDVFDLPRSPTRLTSSFESCLGDCKFFIRTTIPALLEYKPVDQVPGRRHVAKQDIARVQDDPEGATVYCQQPDLSSDPPMDAEIPNARHLGRRSCGCAWCSR